MQDYSPSFTVLATVMLLLTDLTSAPDDKNIGIKYCQKYTKNITDTHIDTAYEKHHQYLCQYSTPILLILIPTQ